MGYHQLTSRATGIGFEVTKVVFRGYGAPARLQKMHDDAIEKRTMLALARETEDQEQQLEDMRLQRERERLQQKQGMEKDTQEHKTALQRARHDAERQAQMEFLQRLQRELGVSGDCLAEYLLALERGRPEKLIQIVGKDGSMNSSTALNCVM